MILKTKPPISNFEKFTHTEQQFLSIAQPLITRHLDNLLSEVRNKYAHFMETTLLKTLYLSLIADKTLLLVSRAAVLELNLARQLSELSGKTPQERFDSFFNHFETDAFFQQYPVLNRFLETILLDFNYYLLEIFNNYAAEWQSLFLDETITPKIIDIETDLKDIYEKGRSVVILQFNNNIKWVYKPRDLSIDAAFQIFLTWFNTKNLYSPFKLLNFVCHKNHSWSEFVERPKDLTQADIETMYQKLGALLCFLYLFDATDMHQKNIIVVGDSPVIIDLETVLQPRRFDNPARSLTQTHLLPEKEEVVVPDETDLAYAYQMVENWDNKVWSAEKLFCGLNEGEDNMQIVRRRLLRHKPDNRLRVNNVPIHPSSFVGVMAKSFRKTYRFIETHKTEFLTAVQCFKKIKIRIIVRDTEKYGVLMEEMNHPALLENAENIAHFLSALDLEMDNSDCDRLIIEEEKKQLYSMATPYFSTFTDKKGLYTSGKLLISDYFKTDALCVVAQNVADMSDKDLNKQVRILRRQFGYIKD